MNRTLAIPRIFLLGLALTVAGCQAGGALLSAVSGTDKVKAQYPFPKRPTLILAESYGNGGDIESDADHLTLNLIKDFKDNNIAPTIDQEVVERLREGDPESFHKMTIDAIGRAVGARQVLYIHILRAEVEMPSGSSAIHGVVDARVHVVDAATGETLWPLEEQEGLLLQTDTPWQVSSPETQIQVRNDMTRLMADGISKLFYDWTPEHNARADEPPQ